MYNSQLFKFIVTGSINTLFYYLVYSIFIFLEFSYHLSVLFATLIGVLFSFKTFGKFVFNNEDKSLIYRFISIYIVLYILNISFIFIFDNYLNNYYISGFFATILCAIFSFILNKKFVFNQ
jgi:putative flippase GtrA